MDSLRIPLPSAALIRIWPVKKYKIKWYLFQCWPCFLFDFFFYFFSHNFLAAEYFKSFSQNSDQNAIHTRRKEKFRFEFYQKTTAFNFSDPNLSAKQMAAEFFKTFAHKVCSVTAKSRFDFSPKKTSAPLTLHLLF